MAHWVKIGSGSFNSAKVNKKRGGFYTFICLCEYEPIQSLIGLIAFDPIWVYMEIYWCGVTAAAV